MYNRFESFIPSYSTDNQTPPRPTSSYTTYPRQHTSFTESMMPYNLFDPSNNLYRPPPPPPPPAQATSNEYMDVLEDLAKGEHMTDDSNSTSSSIHGATAGLSSMQLLTRATAAAPVRRTRKPNERRRLCEVEGCTSQARAFRLCKRHGGSKRCTEAGCTRNVQSRGLCIRHGGGSRCHFENCTRAAQSRGLCKLHGGGRPCIVEGCDKKAHLKRLCRKHGGGAKCQVENCKKWAQRQNMCMSHAKAFESQRQPPEYGLTISYEL